MLQREAEMYTLGALANHTVRDAIILKGVKPEWFTGEREDIARVLINDHKSWMSHYPPIEGNIGAEISNLSGFTANYEYYVDELAKQYRSRVSAPIALKIGELAREGKDATEWIKRLNEIQSSGNGFEPNTPFAEEWESYFDGTRTTIRTGFNKCDAYFPVYTGEYVVFAGRPSAGKTSFLVATLLNITKEGGRVLYFSLDDPYIATIEKMACIHTGQPSDVIKDKGNREKVCKVLQDISELPLEVAPQRIIRLEDILLYAEQAKKLNPDLAVIAVDHMTKILATGSSTYERTTRITTELFALTKRLGVTVMAVSQLNRESEKEGRDLRMSDLRDSGAIEQDCTKLIGFNTPERQDGDLEWHVVGHVLKNKMGSRGKINFTFSGPSYTFREHS